MGIVLREGGYLVSFVQSGGTSPWGYLKAYWGNFALSDQEPAFSVQDTGLLLTEDTSRIVNPFVATL